MYGEKVVQIFNRTSLNDSCFFGRPVRVTFFQVKKVTTRDYERKQYKTWLSILKEYGSCHLKTSNHFYVYLPPPHSNTQKF
ncbi:hypothetical protein D0T08_18465 [Emticicia sp. C21]|nr:hypothetical protein D0T08_18465 [Emticicia sp. C21]